MDRMKTVVINGVPYRMRGDMKLPGWRKSVAANDAFRQGHLNYLTTPASCETKRAQEGDDTTTADGVKYFAGTPVAEAIVVDKPRVKTIILYGAPCQVRGDMHLPNYMKGASRGRSSEMPPTYALTKAVIATLPNNI